MNYIKNQKLKKSLYGVGIIVGLLVIYIISLLMRYPKTEPYYNIFNHFNNLYNIEITTLVEEYDAAHYYKQAEELLRIRGFGPIWDKKDNLLVPWTKEEYPGKAGWIKENEDIWILIQKGSQYQLCISPIGELNYSDHWPPSDETGWFTPEYLVFRLGYLLGENNMQAVEKHLQITAKVFNHYRQKKSLSGSIIALIYEKRLHQVLQADIINNRSRNYYESLVSRCEELNIYSHDAVWKDMIINLGAQRFWIQNYYNGVFEADSTFFGRIKDVVQWRYKTLITSRGKTLKEFDKYFGLLMEQWDVPFSSPRFEEINEEIENTAFLGFLGYFPFHIEIPYLLLSRYATMISASLKLFELDNGFYPDSLNQLIPNYLDEIPLYPKPNSDWIYYNGENGVKLAKHTYDDIEILSLTP